MPRAATRKINPDATYEAWTSFAAADPPNTQVSTGERFRGDHEVVKRNAWWFVEAGSAPHTWPSQLGPKLAEAGQEAKVRGGRGAARNSTPPQDRAVPRSLSASPLDTFRRFSGK